MMINRNTGDVSFLEGLRLGAHWTVEQVIATAPKSEITAKDMPVEGWKHLCLGKHSSHLGLFEVEAVTGSERRIEGVFLSHCHGFYDAGTPEDAERRVFHEGIIATDLAGQREFSWGHVFCRLEPKENRDWLVVIYNPFSNVPMRAQQIDRVLAARETPER